MRLTETRNVVLALRSFSLVRSFACRTRNRRAVIAAVLVSWCTLSLFAAAPTKRSLSHTDFDGWRAIDASTVSTNGAFLGYSYMPQEGDGEIVIRELATEKEQRVAVGALPPQ